MMVGHAVGFRSTEASDQPSGAAAQRALDVLDRIPPDRLRAITLTRLKRLNVLLAARLAENIADLRNRLRAPPADAHGSATG
ncbi:hypothetical protein [Streptomyces sp. NPDC020298]|uniref:hypothetical protein n=1 Tax=unclassified Streptomyces TaxID=2593676 RepID=UPI00340C1776